MSPDRAPAMPEDLDDRLSRAADMTATQEIDGARVAAIGGFAVALDGLIKYHRAVDERSPADRISSSTWWRSPASLSRHLGDRLDEIKLDLDLAVHRFRCGDKGPMADSLASALVALIVVASDLGLDLGEPLAWIVPADQSAPTTVVADQAAS